MSWVLIASTSESGTSPNTVTTPAINTTGADLLYAIVGIYSGNTQTIPFDDSKSNTWSSTTARRQTAGDLVEVQIFWCNPPAGKVGSGHTFRSEDGVNNIYPSLEVYAWSGSSPSSLDQETGAGSSGAVQTHSPGTLTPSKAGCLVVTGDCFADNTSGALSCDGSFTGSELTEPYVGSLSMGTSSAYFVQGAAASVTPTWDIGGPTHTCGQAATLAVFLPAGAPGLSVSIAEPTIGGSVF